jgi:ABC-type dipeptide/oligopeptide/nickel transport system ATPase component
MPKVTKVGSFRKAATASKEQEKPNAGDEMANLSRGQRKRQAKREQYLKREKMVFSTLKLQREEEQKHRLDGMDALKEALITTTTSIGSPEQELPTNSKQIMPTTNKGKKNIAAREMEHMNLVLQHPAFQLNPFESIQQHLRNTLAGQAQELEAKSKERYKADLQTEQAKKQKKKQRIQESGGRHRKMFHAARKT